MIRPGKNRNLNVENVQNSSEQILNEENSILQNESEDKSKENNRQTSATLEEKENSSNDEATLEAAAQMLAVEDAQDKENGVTQTEAYRRYAMGEALAAQEGTRAPASSATRNSGHLKKVSKITLILCGILAAVGIFAGVATTNWGTNSSRADKAESVAQEYFNNSRQTVATAESSIEDAQISYKTAEGYVNEVVNNGEKFNIAYSGNIESQDNQNLSDYTVTTKANDTIVVDMQENLAQAQQSLNEAVGTYETMITYEGESAIDKLNAEYAAKNWDKVNEIGSLIAANAAKISQLTSDVTAKTASVGEAYQSLKSEANAQIQEIANNYVNNTIPKLDTIVKSDIASIEQSVNTTTNYVEKINQTVADESIKNQIIQAQTNATENQNLADAELENYMSLYEQLNQNYTNGDYSKVSELGEQMIDSATRINNYATLANQYATLASNVYGEYQENANLDYTSAVYEVEFTQNDLSNPELMKYLIGAEEGGKVVSVEQSLYNRNNGEVSMLLSCTDLFGNPYTNLITAKIANGLNKEQLTASNLIERLKANEQTTSQVFNASMESVAGANATGTMNAGTNNEVSGNLEILYSVIPSYNDKTGKTTINSQAIALIKDSEGNVLSYKVYKTDPVTKTGEVKDEAILKEEFATKLAQKITSDSSLIIVQESGLELN